MRLILNTSPVGIFEQILLSLMEMSACDTCFLRLWSPFSPEVHPIWRLAQLLTISVEYLTLLVDSFGLTTKVVTSEVFHEY